MANNFEFEDQDLITEDYVTELIDNINRGGGKTQSSKQITNPDGTAFQAPGFYNNQQKAPTYNPYQPATQPQPVQAPQEQPKQERGFFENIGNAWERGKTELAAGLMGKAAMEHQKIADASSNPEKQSPTSYHARELSRKMLEYAQKEQAFDVESWREINGIGSAATWGAEQLTTGLGTMAGDVATLGAPTSGRIYSEQQGQGNIDAAEMGGAGAAVLGLIPFGKPFAPLIKGVGLKNTLGRTVENVATGALGGVASGASYEAGKNEAVDSRMFDNALDYAVAGGALSGSLSVGMDVANKMGGRTIQNIQKIGGNPDAAVNHSVASMKVYQRNAELQSLVGKELDPTTRAAYINELDNLNDNIGGASLYKAVDDFAEAGIPISPEAFHGIEIHQNLSSNSPRLGSAAEFMGLTDKDITNSRKNKMYSSMGTLEKLDVGNKTFSPNEIAESRRLARQSQARDLAPLDDAITRLNRIKAQQDAMVADGQISQQAAAQAKREAQKVINSLDDLKRFAKDSASDRTLVYDGLFQRAKDAARDVAEFGLNIGDEAFNPVMNVGSFIMKEKMMTAQDPSYRFGNTGMDNRPLTPADVVKMGTTAATMGLSEFPGIVGRFRERGKRKSIISDFNRLKELAKDSDSLSYAEMAARASEAEKIKENLKTKLDEEEIKQAQEAKKNADETSEFKRTQEELKTEQKAKTEEAKVEPAVSKPTDLQKVQLAQKGLLPEEIKDLSKAEAEVLLERIKGREDLSDLADMEYRKVEQPKPVEEPVAPVRQEPKLDPNELRDLASREGDAFLDQRKKETERSALNDAINEAVRREQELRARTEQNRLANEEANAKPEITPDDIRRLVNEEMEARRLKEERESAKEQEAKKAEEDKAVESVVEEVQKSEPSINPDELRAVIKDEIEAQKAQAERMRIEEETKATLEEPKISQEELARIAEEEASLQSSRREEIGQMADAESAIKSREQRIADDIKARQESAKDKVIESRKEEAPWLADDVFRVKDLEDISEAMTARARRAEEIAEAKRIAQEEANKAKMEEAKAEEVKPVVERSTKDLKDIIDEPTIKTNKVEEVPTSRNAEDLFTAKSLLETKKAQELKTSQERIKFEEKLRDRGIPESDFHKFNDIKEADAFVAERRKAEAENRTQKAEQDAIRVKNMVSTKLSEIEKARANFIIDKSAEYGLPEHVFADIIDPYLDPSSGNIRALKESEMSKLIKDMQKERDFINKNAIDSAEAAKFKTEDDLVKQLVDQRQVLTEYADSLGIDPVFTNKLLEANTLGGVKPLTLKEVRSLANQLLRKGMKDKNLVEAEARKATSKVDDKIKRLDEKAALLDSAILEAQSKIKQETPENVVTETPKEFVDSITKDDLTNAMSQLAKEFESGNAKVLEKIAEIGREAIESGKASTETSRITMQAKTISKILNSIEHRRSKGYDREVKGASGLYTGKELAELKEVFGSGSTTNYMGSGNQQAIFAAFGLYDPNSRPKLWRDLETYKRALKLEDSALGRAMEDSTLTPDEVNFKPIEDIPERQGIKADSTMEVVPVYEVEKGLRSVNEAIDAGFEYALVDPNREVIIDYSNNHKSAMTRANKLGLAAIPLLTMLSTQAMASKDPQGAGEMNKLVYDASKIGDIKGTPFTEAMGYSESRGRYNIENSFGYIGKFQMGWQALVELGAIRRDKTGRGNKGILGDSNNWTGKYGVNSKEEFLNSPQAQEAAMKDMVAMSDRIIKSYGLDKYIGQTIDGIPITWNGLRASAQLAGHGGLRQALRKGDLSFADGYGTTIRKYMAYGATIPEDA